MNLITAFIAWVFDARHVNTQSRDEKYLAAAVDICDLERRMRALDQHSAIGPFGQNA